MFLSRGPAVVQAFAFHMSTVLGRCLKQEAEGKENRTKIIKSCLVTDVRQKCHFLDFAKLLFKKFMENRRHERQFHDDYRGRGGGARSANGHKTNR